MCKSRTSIVFVYYMPHPDRICLSVGLWIMHVCQRTASEGKAVNSGGCTRSRVVRLGSSATSSRNPAPILPIVDIRERGPTAGRCVPKFLAQCVVVDRCTAYHFVLRADTEDEDPQSTHLTPTVDVTGQKEAILKMSHGVAVILLLGET